MTPATTDARLIVPLPAEESVAPIPTPDWGAELTSPATLVGHVDLLRGGWVMALMAAALALAVALCVLAMVTAHGGPTGTTSPGAPIGLQVGNRS